jgi:hypothetical protein|tara:strand:+ start:24976 stop:25236 length:261 start_codon:yes stop_codon:yes gene_type:complete
MTVFSEVITLSQISHNGKIKRKGKVATFKNGKRTFFKLNDNQIKNLMGVRGSKKTLKQRLGGLIKKSKTRKRRKRKIRKKKSLKKK